MAVTHFAMQQIVTYVIGVRCNNILSDRRRLLKCYVMLWIFKAIHYSKLVIHLQSFCVPHGGAGANHNIHVRTGLCVSQNINAILTH